MPRNGFRWRPAHARERTHTANVEPFFAVVSDAKGVTLHDLVPDEGEGCGGQKAKGYFPLS